MQARKITVVSTKNQTKNVFMSEATTLAELKNDMRLNGIDYTDMAFYEGTSKTELRFDESILPHDVPYKGTITNELVFLLTNTNKKIKSGAMTRKEAYLAIKELHLEEAVRETFGKNFTQVKTDDLVELIDAKTTYDRVKGAQDTLDELLPKTKEEPKKSLKELLAEDFTIAMDCAEDHQYIDVDARNVLKKLIKHLFNADYMPYKLMTDLIKELDDKFVEKQSELSSSYSEDDIEEMWSDLDDDYTD